jgi:hypothetical protein
MDILSSGVSGIGMKHNVHIISKQILENGYFVTEWNKLFIFTFYFPAKLDIFL